jgi:hypothetical protein
MTPRALVTLFAPFLVATNIALADLVSYWPLDETEGETAVDSVGSNDAIWQNAGLNLAWTEGRIGGGADLSDLGGNNYFQMNLPELIGAESLTFSTWINNDANAGYTGIFMTRSFNGATNNSWGIAIEPDGGGSWRFDSRVNGPGIDSAAAATPVDGEWKHLALVWDGAAGTQTQYVNGVESATGVSVIGPIVGPDSGPWYIGYDDCCGGGRDFDGKIDEVAVWNQVLTPAEIALLASGARPDLLDSADTDGDGMPNEYEDMFAFLDPNEDGDADLDQDGDGLNNLEEFIRGTDPEDTDTDDDTLTDGEEVNTHGTNPKLADTDGDEIDDPEELVEGADTFVTDPLLADTDMDGFDDGEEVTNGTDPTDSTDPPPAAPMLIGHWPLDETSGDVAADAVSGNDGIWQNAEGLNLEWTAGQIGGAARLSDLGGDSFFRIETINELISSNALTITAWIEPDENPGYNGIFMTRTIDNQTNNSWGIAFENTGALPNHLDTRVDKAPTDSAIDTLLPDGGWYHVALVWDGAAGTHTQYINGVESATAEGVLSRQIQATSGPWFIGYDDCCGGARDFNGLIDDIGMWNQALTAQEILDIHDNGLNGIGIGGPATRFEITAVSINADDSVTLTWRSDPREGTEYAVLFNGDLETAPDEWADVDDGVPTGGETTTFTTGPGFTTSSELFFIIRRN